MVNVTEVLSNYDGVCRAKHLAAAGVSDFQLKSALARGDVVRVARGVYAVPEADAQLVAIRSLPAEPACVTAAQFRGLWVLHPSPRPHVAVPHSRHYPGFVCHRSAAPPTLLDTVVQCLRCLPDLDGLVIAESAVVANGVNIPGMGHLDLMVDGRLGIETDGAGFHMDRTSFEEDRRRWNVTTRLGIPTLVVSYGLLLYRPDEFIAIVRETLSTLSAAA